MAIIERELTDGHAESPRPRPRLWTRDEYYKMADVGILREDERVELIDGEILEMAPIGPGHGNSAWRLNKRLNELLSDDFIAMQERPITLSDLSEPQPDLIVVRGPIELYDNRHPTASDIVLLIEISKTSLAIDRTAKQLLYANAVIPEYWIVNLASRQLEVFREPSPTGYAAVTIIGRDQVVELSFASAQSIQVKEFLA